MITIMIINVVRVFCTFSLCTDAPSPQKKRFFLRGGGGLYTDYCRRRAINIPSHQTVEKNLAVKGGRKVNNIKSSIIETDKALFCHGILLSCTGKHQSQ